MARSARARCALLQVIALLQVAVGQGVECVSRRGTSFDAFVVAEGRLANRQWGYCHWGKEERCRGRGAVLRQHRRLLAWRSGSRLRWLQWLRALAGVTSLLVIVCLCCCRQ